MSESNDKKLRREIAKLEKKLKAQMEFEANEVLQIIKEEWSWREKFKLVWFLLVPKKKAILDFGG